MNRDRLKNIVQSSYNRENWINTLQFLSGNKNLLNITIDPIHFELSTKKATDIVKNLLKLGTLKTSDGISLPIFEIELQPNIKIEYNKVGVNQLIKEFILKDAGKGAIATYFYENEKHKEWRFSFISKFGGSEFFNEVEDVETNPKKYTYIFGTQEEHRTALERLYNLEQSLFRLEDFFEAFNVEPVSNNFFKEYKNFYLDFVNYLSSNKICRAIFENEIKEDLKSEEKNEKVNKDIRNFVKRLLGRIVFLYFLQKKRWLGASNTNYEDGDINFLFHLFESNKENFYANWLSKLFFNTLNTPNRPNESFELTNLNKVCVPFLNGGLFEEHQEPRSHKLLFFPAYLFEELFSFFNGYNFTIYENSPEDHIIAVDPEMLGNIFENLLEDNKDKGTFYTPKEIVHYMTQESLIEYLNTHLKDKSKEQIENLVKNHVKDNISRDDLKTIETLIDKVKICDPAIGSGAFPMGLLQEIFSLKAFIHFALDRNQKDWNPAKIKQDIIQNSIYGVDLEEGAVDIARLRFWLSLVVDEDKPKPLPNLDYKIMQGNSLLESFEGIPLGNANLFNEPTDKNITLFEEPIENYGLGDDIKKLMDDYFNPKNYNKKHAIHKAIDKKVIDFIDKCLEGYENQLLIELAGAKQTLNRKTELSQKALPITKEINRIEGLLESKSNARLKLIEYEQKAERPYFLWKLFFNDVFNQGGFDIVIGNPPYRQLQKMGKEADLLQKEGYETFRKTGDIYALFYEKANTILKPKGILSYITSNTWMRTKSGDGLRNYFTTKTNILTLLNFEDTQIFPSATVEVNILLSKKEPWDGEIRATAIKSTYKKGTDIAEYENKNHIIITEVSNDSWVILDSISTKIKLKIENIGIPLSQWNNENWNVEFYRGFLTGFNDAFFIDEDTKNKIIAQEPKAEKIIKPLLRGRNIAKYNYEFDHIYVLFISWHFPLEKEGISGSSEKAEKEFEIQYPVVYAHLKKYKENLENRNISETGIRYEWYALQRAAATYVDEFNKEKIVWLSISDKPAFALDNSNMYVTAPAYIMTSQCNKYLLALLNSKTMEWYLDKVSSSTGQGTNQWSKIFVEQLPLPQLKDIEIKRKIENLVDYLIFLNNKMMEKVNPYADNKSIAQTFEEVLNMMIFELYFKDEMVNEEIDVLQFISDDVFKPIIEDNKENAMLLGNIFKWLQEQENPIRNRIILSNIRSKNTIRIINSSTS